MDCLRELVEFVSANLDQKQIGEVMKEVQSTPKVTGLPPKDKERYNEWEDWWKKMLAEKPEYSIE